MTITLAQLTGQQSDHLVSFQSGGQTQLVVPELVDAWRGFCACAEAAGFAPIIVSGFRSFDRQLAIWNAKATGARPVFDESDRPVLMSELDDFAKVLAILKYSALPGTSRHHWGTDIDITDVSDLPDDYELQLTESETRAGGVCARFYQWLDAYESDDWVFSRPYLTGRCDVASEPWHLSLKSVAAQYEGALDPAAIKLLIGASDIALKPSLLAHFDEIFERYVISSAHE